MVYKIVANSGTFDNIETAAFAEKDINWWDNNDKRTTVCTESYAAIELIKNLKKLFGNAQDGNVEFIINEVCECKDLNSNLILIGNSITNPLIDMLESKCGYCISANDSVNPEGFRINSFYMNECHYIVLSGHDREGTLNGVYAFLEKLGLKWFGAGEIGKHFPEIPLDTIPEMDISENPQFTTRGIYSEYLDDSCNDLVEWASYNHMNYAHFFKTDNSEYLKKRGLKVSGGGHNVLFRFMDPDQEYPYKHVIYGGEGKPEDPYALSSEYTGDLDGDGKLSYIEAHPEWYPLVNGKRICFRDRKWAKECYFTGDNFCTTNNDAVTELCKLIVNDLISGEWSKLDFLDFWMLDNGHWCECEECKKSGNLTYKMIMVVYSLDKAIKAAIKEGRLKRDVRIVFPAYHETLPAPDTTLPSDFDYKNCLVTYFPIERCYVHNIDDVNCTETNQILLQKLLPWLDNTSGNYKGEVFIGEYYNVSSFVSLPIVLSQRIIHDIPYYFSKGVKHFYYMHMTAGKWSVLTLNNYLYAKLLWNPEFDCEELMSEFFKLYYKEVSNEMEAFYTLLEKATSNMKYLKHYQEAKGIRTSIAGRIINKSDDLFPFKHMQYDFIIDDPNAGISLVDVVKLFDQCRYLLDSTILKAHNELVIERLIFDDMRLTYGDCMVKFYYNFTKMNLYKLKGRNNLAKSAFKTVKLYAESLRGMTEPFDCYYYGNEFKNGLSATWIDKEYNKLVEEYDK